MDVYEIKISKKQLQSIPDAERVLILQFGHVCNELSFLNKLLLVVYDTEIQGLKKRAMTVQSMIVIRLYVGKVFEAWRMLESDYFGSQLSKSLDALLGPEGRQSLEVLKTYFGRNNLLSTVRNDFSFHYGSKHFPETMAAFEDSYEFQLILGQNYANTLHSFCEDFVVVGMLKATGKNEPRVAMDRIVGDLVTIGGKMIDFLGRGLAAVFENRVGKSWDDFEYTAHKVEPDADIRKFKFPFFFSG
jgi:hypothetical protein